MFDKISKDLGHPIQEFPLDGTIHRFSSGDSTKFPLWASGVEFEHSKKKIQYANYGNWRTGESFKYCSVNPESETSQFRSKLSSHVKKVEESINQERESKNKECEEKYNEIFSQLPEQSECHPYMSLKGFTQNYSARIDRSTLMIPVYYLNENQETILAGCQKIFKGDPGKYVKVFSTGIRKRGSFMMPVKFDILNTDYAYLCEGFATACSVHEATGMPTISCIDSGNMQACIASLRQANPGLKLIICADDDFETKRKIGKNPGIDAAYHAKKCFSNSLIKIPKFKVRITETDFNDLMILEGKEAVADQLSFSYSEFCDIDILGHEDHKKFFFFSTESLKTISLSTGELSQTHLVAIASSKFWAEKYGYRKDAEGNQTDIPDWPKIIDSIAQLARRKGNFSWKNVRGVGIWKEDDGRAVINLGDRIYDNGNYVDIGKFRSKFKYQSTVAIHLNTDKKCDIITPLRLLKYKRPGDHIILAGWCAIAPFFNVLEWRPHVWINGPRGSGKSTVMQLISKIVWGSKIFIDSTAAGIRQSMKYDSYPILIDEAEPDSYEGKGRISAILEMIRHSSTNGESNSVRGTSSGEAYELTINSIFMLGSIANSLDKKSDVSRFLTVDLDEIKGQTNEEYQTILNGFSSVCPSSLMMQSLKRLPYILKNIEIIKGIMRGRYDPRQCDQIAPLLAGYFSLLSDGFLGVDAVDSFLDQLNLDMYIEQSSESEADSCLEAIMSVIWDRAACKTIENSIYFGQDLSHLGIKVFSRDKIFIASKNEELSKLLPDDFKKYGKLLRIKYPGRKERIFQKVKDGMVIDLKW